MTIVRFDHYYVEMEHRRLAGAASTEIHIKAKDLPTAARDVWRFYESRKKIMPELFGKLLCVKIYGFTVGEIDSKGNYMSRITMCMFEWKCDMGWTYEQRIDRAQAWLERGQQPGVI